MSTWYEYSGNIHIHTQRSDGTGSVPQLAQAAEKAGLDFLVITDHNTMDKEEEGYHGGVLVLIGEEVHIPNARENHLLCLGIEEDVSAQAHDPQAVIDRVRQQGGLTFLAHPIERSAPLVPEIYPWTDWRVRGFTGIELWNYMSSFREFATNKLMGLLLSFLPQMFPVGPLPETLSLWDDLLAEGPVVAIGGSDAHGQYYRLGPIRRRIFPYEFLFRAVNTHILTPRRFSREAQADARLVYDALAQGHAWVAYDLIYPTDHFRFWATWEGNYAISGDTIPLKGEVSLHVVLPAPARILLRRNGVVIQENVGQTLYHRVSDAGTYRVEVWKKAWGKERGWIFANPIYIVAEE